MLIKICLLILWLVLGTSGFIFWWTKDWDFKKSDVPFALMCSVGGILCWFIGFLIHGENKIIIPRRERLYKIK